jgi:hypothetical protein
LTRYSDTRAVGQISSRGYVGSGLFASEVIRKNQRRMTRGGGTKIPLAAVF